jgi:hypothetical protein
MEGAVQLVGVDLAHSIGPSSGDKLVLGLARSAPERPPQKRQKVGLTGPFAPGVLADNRRMAE